MYNNVRFYFNKMREFLCFSAKRSIIFSKSFIKSLSIAKTHRPLNRLSDILFLVWVLISLILLNVRPHVVEEIGIVNATTRSDIVVGKACFNGNNAMYKSTIFSDRLSFNIGFSACISLHKDENSTFKCVANGRLDSM